MLIGEYSHRLDPKRRLSLPAKFRRELGDAVVLTRGLDRCLFVYTSEEWKGIADKLGRLPVGQSRTRQFVRMILAGAEEAEVDGLGRVLIPEHLATYANLKGQVVITGIYSRVEIWDKDLWEEYREKVSSEADALAEELGKQGMY